LIKILKNGQYLFEKNLNFFSRKAFGRSSVKVKPRTFIGALKVGKSFFGIFPNFFSSAQFDRRSQVRSPHSERSKPVAGGPNLRMENGLQMARLLAALVSLSKSISALRHPDRRDVCPRPYGNRGGECSDRTLPVNPVIVATDGNAGGAPITLENIKTPRSARCPRVSLKLNNCPTI
jgi:hypothetical protein